MTTLIPSRPLVIPLGDRELTVTVDDHDAVLDLVPAHAAGSGGAPPDLDRAVSIRVPAPALIAALHVAWAAEHDRFRAEPWSDGTGVDGYDREYGTHWYDDGGDADLPGGDADLPGSDADGRRDPTVVPFPGLVRHRCPRRSGVVWEPWEHDVLREAWLAAAPDADKKALVRELAERLERGVGGVWARLRLAGCDPTRPGSEWDGRRGRGA